MVQNHTAVRELPHIWSIVHVARLQDVRFPQPNTAHGASSSSSSSSSGGRQGNQAFWGAFIRSVAGCSLQNAQHRL